MKTLTFSRFWAAADANPRLYDRLIAACSVIMVISLVAIILLAVQPAFAMTSTTQVAHAIASK